MLTSHTVRVAFLVIVATFSWGTAMPAVGAEESHCADCHFARPGPWDDHVAEWQVSAHGRSGVGCESCHGGDPTRWDPLLAHRDLLGAGNPASPVHPTRLAETCGRCHRGQWQAFADTRHRELVAAGDPHAPSCSSCHGDVGAYLLSTRALTRVCRHCHGEEGESAVSYAELAADVHQQLVELRQEQRAAARLVARIEAPERRRRLEELLAAAREPLEDAVESAHSFRFVGFGDRLREARERTERLLEALANPLASP